MAVPDRRRITAEEFFTMIPETTDRYELFDGVIKAQAAPNFIHQKIIGGLHYNIFDFIRGKSGGCEPIISPFDVELDNRNVVQPDFMVVCDRSKLDGKRCNGAPDMAVEVVSSNRTDDYIRKLELYRRFGVREYWIVDPEQEKTIVYLFTGEKSVDFHVYSFDEDIPVGIFGGEPKICINDLML